MNDPLVELERIASGVGASEIADQARSLAVRVAEGLFYVACVGQFKRGKSTLLNALIGQPLLPVGVSPVTAVITIVRYGAELRAIVHYDDGRDQSIDPAALGEYIAEEKNPENAKRVRIVEVYVPSELLSSGMCLVDTPGLGSIFRQNTDTTRAFLPHIDATVVVLGADPPISGEEAALAEEIAREAPHMLFVLNKADRLDATQLGEAVKFTRNALERRLKREAQMFVVSALEPDKREFAALQESLAALARDAGADIVRSASERGQRRIAEQLRAEIDGQRDALTRPIAESESLVATLRQTIDDAQRTLGDLGYLFTAEQHRLTSEFNGERKRFLEAALPAARSQLDAAIHAIDAKGSRLRDESFHAAERIAQQTITAWLEEVEPRAEELYARATARFVELAQDFIRRIEAAAVSSRAADVGIEQRFRKRRGFYFTGLWHVTGRPPGAAVIDVFRSRAAQYARTRREAQTFLQRLIESNSARVANDLTDRVLESRRSLEVEIRVTLQRASQSAERALAKARTAQQEGEAAVERDLARLAEASERLRMGVRSKV